jgi:hypothetical protein
MKIRILFFLWLQTLAPISISAQGVINVPDGKPVMIDGKCRAEEWQDATHLTASKDYKLSFKKTKDYVFICIATPQERTFVVDLYLSAADKKLYTLHASAKLGERMLHGEKWKEWTVDWNWWDVDDWWASTSRPVSFQQQTFLPKEAIEFQISRKRFTGKQWRVMFDIMSNSSLLSPENANNLKSDTWLEVNLGR